MGDQEYYFNEQDQEEHFDQGKYNMGSSLFPIHLNTFNSYLYVLPYKDFVELYLCLDSYGILHWVAIACAQPKL